MMKISIYLFLLMIGINLYFENCELAKPYPEPKAKVKSKYKNADERATEMVDSNYDVKYPKRN